MAIHNGYLLHLVIPSAFRAARKMQMISFAFSRFRQENQLASFNNIFAFCYRHKMQLGTLDCGTRSFAFLAAGKKQWQFITVTSCIWSFHLHVGPLAKCKWFLLRSVLSDRKTDCYLRCYLSAFPSAVEMQIICDRAGRKPSRRQG